MKIQMRDFEVREVKIVSVCDGSTTTPTLALDDSGNIYSFNVRKDVQYKSDSVHTLKMLVQKIK